MWRKHNLITEDTFRCVCYGEKAQIIPVKLKTKTLGGVLFLLNIFPTVCLHVVLYLTYRIFTMQFKFTYTYLMCGALNVLSSRQCAYVLLTETTHFISNALKKVDNVTKLKHLSEAQHLIPLCICLLKIFKYSIFHDTLRLYAF